MHKGPDLLGLRQFLLLLRTRAVIFTPHGQGKGYIDQRFVAVVQGEEGATFWGVRRVEDYVVIAAGNIDF